MKRKKLLALLLSLLMLLALAPGASAAQLPIPAEWLDGLNTGVSLRDMIDETRDHIDLAGSSFQLENILFLEELVAGEETALCICESNENYMILDESALPPGCRVELREETVRIPDAKDGLQVAEEIRLEKAGQTPEQKEADIDPADRDRTTRYLYLTGTPGKTGNFLFVLFDGKLRLVEVQVLAEKPVHDEPAVTEPPAVTDPPAVTEPPEIIEEPTELEPVVTDPPAATEPPVVTATWVDELLDPATPAPTQTPAPAVVLPTPSVTVKGAATVRAGESVQLEAEVTDGHNPGYQWYVWDDAGQSWSPLTGATDSRYRPDTSAAGTRAYLCEVVNHGDNGQSVSAYSDYVTVTVQAQPAQPTPTALPRPSVSVTGATRVEQGETAVLEAHATNTYNASYQWYVGQTPIEDGTGDKAQYRPDTSSAGTQTYTVLVVNNGDYGETSYAFSDPVTVTVEEKPALPTPTVILAGASKAAVNDSVLLEAIVSNGYNLSYQWFTRLGTYDAPLNGADAKTSQIRPDTSKAGTWTYFCRVTSSAYGQTVTVDSEPVTLTVSERQTRQISAVIIDTKPKKLSYSDGERLDTTGLRLLVRYNDGSAEYVTSGFTAGPTVINYNNSNTANVAVRYGGYTLTYQISVRSQQQAMADMVRGIGVLTMPNKTSYTVGEALDTTGMKIRVWSTDGRYLDIGEGFECSPTRFNGTGNQTVTVSFLGKTCTFTVAVSQARRLLGLSIQSLPSNRSYAVGDTINASGLVLQLQTSSGYETVTGGYSISPRVASGVGTQMVTVSYEGLTANYTIEVRENNIPRLSPTPMPTPFAFASPTPAPVPSGFPTPALLPGTSATPAPGLSASPAPTATARPVTTPAPARRNTGVSSLVKVLFVVAILALAGLIGYVLYLRKHDFDGQGVPREEKPSETLHKLFSKKNGKDP